MVTWQVSLEILIASFSPILYPSPFAFFKLQACWKADRCIFTSILYLAPSHDSVLFIWLHYHTLGSSTNQILIFPIFFDFTEDIKYKKCDKYILMSTIPYGQAYKRNQGDGLGIELIIELTVWNSKHGQRAFVIVGNWYWHVSGN